MSMKPLPIRRMVRVSPVRSLPHFLSPSFSLSYSGEDLQATLSYRKSLHRPAYSSLNNFTLLENQYVYQQGSPFLLNETNDALQLLGTYKTLSFSASYNYIGIRRPQR